MSVFHGQRYVCSYYRFILYYIISRDNYNETRYAREMLRVLEGVCVKSYSNVLVKLLCPNAKQCMKINKYSANLLYNYTNKKLEYCYLIIMKRVAWWSR